MGPRPDGRGKPVCCSLGGQTGSVNGAAARRPRKGQVRSQPVCHNALRQWGRGQTAAESLQEPLTYRRILLASMGPRPDGRGKSAHRQGGGAAPSVNGAAARRPRKAVLARARRSAAIGVNGAAARRPRKVRVHADGQAHAAASMGPRPDGRGKVFLTGALLSRFLRQWGRGQTAAERAGWPARTCAGPCASMGPRPDGRGKSRQQARLAVLDGASMGPRPDGRGKFAL